MRICQIVRVTHPARCVKDNNLKRPVLNATMGTQTCHQYELSCWMQRKTSKESTVTEYCDPSCPPYPSLTDICLCIVMALDVFHQQLSPETSKEQRRMGSGASSVLNRAPEATTVLNRPSSQAYPMEWDSSELLWLLDSNGNDSCQLGAGKRI